MKFSSYIYLIFSILLSTFLYANTCPKFASIPSDDLHIIIPVNDKECDKNVTMITYESINPSLGPVNGYNIFTALIKPNNNSAINLATGEKLNGENIPYLNLILSAIDQRPISEVSITYDKDGFPLKITILLLNSEIAPGIGHTINILKHQKVDNFCTLNGRDLQMKYFEDNYKKWTLYNKETYTFNYQDNLIENKYIDGLEVGIENNNTIYSLIDTFHQTPIDISEKDSVLTINQQFDLVHTELLTNPDSEIIVSYDRQYGYPYYINIRANQNDNREIYSSIREDQPIIVY